MDFIEKLIELGFQKQAEKLKSVELPSIVLKTQPAAEEDFSPGESKVGGQPHVPANFTWPRYKNKPLAFLAQINLADAAAYDEENLLPKSGLLSFFYEGGDEVWGFDPKDKGAFKVFHFPEFSGFKAVPPPQGVQDYLVFSPCKIIFERAPSYPYDTYGLDMELFNGAVPDSVFDMYDETLEGPLNKMFGHPNLAQGNIFYEAQLAANGIYCGNPEYLNNPRVKELEGGIADWLLLLQLESDEKAQMMWGDAGTVYFVIRKEDLAKGNFADIWTVLQCG